MSTVTANNSTTASQYTPSSSNQKDTSGGFIQSKVGGSLSYQSGTGEQGLSESLLGGMKLSDALKHSGKVRVGSNFDEIENIGSQSYSPNSEKELGYSAVSATGRQHTHASEIKADSIIKVGGVEAQAEALFKAGIIGKNEQGQYTINDGGSTVQGKKRQSW